MWLLLLDVVQLGHVEGVGVFETPLDASAAATIQTPKFPTTSTGMQHIQTQHTQMQHMQTQHAACLA